MFPLKGKNDGSGKFKGLRKNGSFDYIPHEGFSWQQI